MKINSKLNFTVNRPVAITMVVLGVAVFGLVSYLRLSWNLMPEMSYPSFTVRTEYEGAAPEEVENVVSRPLEEQLGLIKNLVSLTSISRPEQSDIVLEFTWDVDLDKAAQEIRERIDQVYLDRDVERPMILRYDPSLDPIIRIGLTSETLELMETREIADEILSRELETIPGVAAVRVKGGLEKEILVKVDENKLARTRITLNTIISRLSEENINLAGGNVKEGETEYIIRTLNEFKRVDEIGEIIISSDNNIPIRLKDIASVKLSHKEREVITRVNRKESIELNIYKEADANIVEVCKLIKKRIFGTLEQRNFTANLDKEKKRNDKKQDFRAAMNKKRMTNYLAYEYGKDIEFMTLADQSVFIENSINEVKNTALLGGLLAIIILYLFLKHFGTTVIAAVSIPISIVATFAPMRLFGVSLNIMSLGGLALGIGMLVDNSIVVMESVFRCREEGDSWTESAVRGVSEVASAVVASTLTTIAVFFPIVFVEGVAGQIFGDLSITVVFSLIASLLVALFFIPMLASRKYENSLSIHEKIHFKIEEEKKLSHFLLFPVQFLMFSLTLVKHFLLFFTVSLLSLILALLSPILLPLKLEPKLFSLLSKFKSVFENDSLKLWRDYITIKPYENFRNLLLSRINMFFKIIGFIYFFFKFLLNLVFTLFSRIIFLFSGMFILALKCVIILFSALFVPLVKIASGLFDRIIDKVYAYYPVILKKALDHDIKVIASVFTLFLISVFVILPQIGSELIPEVHQGAFYVNVTLPVGSPVQKTDSVLYEISGKIDDLPLVQDVNYYGGTTKDDLSGDEAGEHLGKITVNIKSSSNIQKAEEKTIKEIRMIMKNVTDVDYLISRPVLFSFKTPIEVEIKGYNLESLKRVSSELTQKISSIPGLKDVQSSLKPGYPEMVIKFNREKLAHYGLNSYQAATLVKNKIEGNVASRFKEEDRRIDIRVYLKDEQRKQAFKIKNLIINPGEEIQIPLSAVANIELLNGPNEIRRIDQKRSAVITANIDGISLNEAVEDIYTILRDYPFPKDFSFDMSGQNKEMQTSLNSLLLALILAVFLVYLVMASQFESFLHPFLILFTIPMALIGVILTLYVINVPVGVTVFIGLITLAGIVVNNAIVLVDYINLLRKKGLEKVEAIAQAGKVRLRPILITTLTTVLGLLPMALGMGEGAEIRTPMAITIIAGLLSSTFLTLILIPVVYKKFSR